MFKLIIPVVIAVSLSACVTPSGASKSTDRINAAGAAGQAGQSIEGYRVSTINSGIETATADASPEGEARGLLTMRNGNVVADKVTRFLNGEIDYLQLLQDEERAQIEPAPTTETDGDNK